MSQSVKNALLQNPYVTSGSKKIATANVITLFVLLIFSVALPSVFRWMGERNGGLKNWQWIMVSTILADTLILAALLFFGKKVKQNTERAEISSQPTTVQTRTVRENSGQETEPKVVERHEEMIAALKETVIAREAQLAQLTNTSISKTSELESSIKEKDLKIEHQNKRVVALTQRIDQLLDNIQTLQSKNEKLGAQCKAQAIELQELKDARDGEIVERRRLRVEMAQEKERWNDVLARQAARRRSTSSTPVQASQSEAAPAVSSLPVAPEEYPRAIAPAGSVFRGVEVAPGIEVLTDGDFVLGNTTTVTQHNNGTTTVATTRHDDLVYNEAGVATGVQSRTTTLHTQQGPIHVKSGGVSFSGAKIQAKGGVTIGSTTSVTHSS